MSWEQLNRLGVRCRPIIDWPGGAGGFTRNRKRSPFKAAWSTTVAGLTRELRHLGARDINLHIAVPEHKIVQDGTRPYADARADHPGVVLAFESKDGSLHFAVDTFRDWQENLRAIVLTLENLRAIERYGTVKQNQQYRGFRALPDPGGPIALGQAAPPMALDAAAAFVVGLDGVNVTAEQILAYPDIFKDVYRMLARRLHPDVPGGDGEKFGQLVNAKAAIDAHHQRKGAANA